LTWGTFVKNAIAGYAPNMPNPVWGGVTREVREVADVQRTVTNPVTNSIVQPIAPSSPFTTATRTTSTTTRTVTQPTETVSRMTTTVVQPTETVSRVTTTVVEPKTVVQKEVVTPVVAKSNLSTKETVTKTVVQSTETVSVKDDLKKIEGIGPKIEELLNNVGIMTFVQLSVTPQQKLQEVLDTAGKRFAMHDPTSWTLQANLASKNDWEALKQLQAQLIGGKAK
jgi:predicted flap endonuclease-1-like 5' DNA nuclease